MVAERTILKWAKFKPGVSMDQMSEALPYGQNIGEYLARASNPPQVPVGPKDLHLHDSLVEEHLGLIDPKEESS